MEKTVIDDCKMIVKEKPYINNEPITSARELQSSINLNNTTINQTFEDLSLKNKFSTLPINRCQFDSCKKKLSITESITKCKCNMMFCLNHRQSSKHKCTFNYKTEASKNIENKLLDGRFNKLNKI